MNDFLKTAAYLSLLGHVSKTADNTERLRKFEEEKFLAEKKRLQEEQDEALDDAVLESIYLNDLSKIESGMESDYGSISSEDVLEVYGNRCENVDLKLLDDLDWKSCPEGVKFRGYIELKDLLLSEVLILVMKYIPYWQSLTVEQKMLDNRLTLERLAKNGDAVLNKISSRIEQISDNKSSLIYARSEGVIHASDLDIAMLAGRNSRRHAYNPTKLILFAENSSTPIAHISYKQASFPSEAYGQFSLKGLLLWEGLCQIWEEKDLANKGIELSLSESLVAIKNDLYDVSWNTAFFEVINSLDDYIVLTKQHINSSRSIDMSIKRLDAEVDGRIAAGQFLRSGDGKWIAGVCVGMKHCYGIPVWLSRVLFVVFTGAYIAPFVYLVIALSFKDEKDVLQVK